MHAYGVQLCAGCCGREPRCRCVPCLLHWFSLPKRNSVRVAAHAVGPVKHVISGVVQGTAADLALCRYDTSIARLPQYATPGCKSTYTPGCPTRSHPCQSFSAADPLQAKVRMSQG